MARIFVSYKRKNKKRVLEIVNQIEIALNEKCFIDYNEIETNAYFMDIICKAIDESNIVLFMHSSLHNKIDYDNDWTIKEYRYAKEKNKNVVLVKLDYSKLDNVFLFEFGSRNYVDSQDSDQVDKLIKDIAKWLKIKIINHDVPVMPSPELPPIPRPHPLSAKWLYTIAALTILVVAYFISPYYQDRSAKSLFTSTDTIIRTQNAILVPTIKNDLDDELNIIESATTESERPTVTSVQSVTAKQVTTKHVISSVLPSAATGEINGYAYVDLGLSVLWATCNIGALTPEQSGSFFAWGETGNKVMFTWNSYRWMDDDVITKYGDDGKDVLETADDAAGIKWGARWHIPSSDDINELIEKCRWEWKKVNDTEGYLITSNVPGFEGRSIFLPVAGKREGNATGSKTNGYYWTSSKKNGTPAFAELLYFDAKDKRVYADSRYVGRSVRPVSNKQ